jgi:hypothetical protein
MGGSARIIVVECNKGFYKPGKFGEVACSCGKKAHK